MKLMNSPIIHPRVFRHKFQSRYDHLIDRDFFLGRDPFSDYKLVRSAKTPINIKEQREYYEIEIPLTSYRKNEISIQIENNILTVKGNKEQETEGNSKYIIKEHDVDNFERSFQLGPITNQDNITARFLNGILYIRLYHIEDLVSRSKEKTIPIL